MGLLYVFFGLVAVYPIPSNLDMQSPWNSAGMARSQEKGGPGARVGYRGMQSYPICLSDVGIKIADLWLDQQLLANWRRARGKERDALLWGDEVCCFSRTMFFGPGS